LGQTLAESKTGPFCVQVFDSGPDQEAVVVIVVGDDVIIQLIAYFGEEDVGGF
jgi:hypothetical protein